MTYSQATARHLFNLTARGWAVSPALKVPHATSPCGEFRLYFKPQAVYAAAGTGALGSARSIHVDPRKVPTAALIREGRGLATVLRQVY